MPQSLIQTKMMVSPQTDSSDLLASKSATPGHSSSAQATSSPPTAAEATQLRFSPHHLDNPLNLPPDQLDTFFAVCLAIMFLPRNTIQYSLEQ